MFANRRFQFHPILTIVAAFAFLFLLSLGNWQLKRLAWKQDLIAKVEASQGADPIAFEDAVMRAEAGENMEYMPVTFTGRVHFDKPATVFGSYEGVAGIYFFAPVAPSKGQFVYVNQGFVSQEVASQGLPMTRLSETPVNNISGLFRYAEQPAPPSSWLLPSTPPEDGLWLVRDPTKFAAAAKIEAQPYYVDSFAIDGVDWPKGGTTRLDFSNRHLDYALTWFAAAAAMIGVCVAFSLQKRE